MRRKKKKIKKSNKEFLVIMYLIPGSVSVYDDLFCLFSGM